MGELDPFGREKGEDSLKEMGWTVPSAAPAPVAAPASTAASAATSAPTLTPPAPPAPPRPRRSSGAGLLVLRLIIPIVVLAGVGIGIAAAVDSGTKAIHRISIPQFTIPQLTVPAAPSVTPAAPVPAAPAAPPTGLSGASMLRPARMASAIARLRGLGRLSLMRVAPERIDAQIVHGRALRIMQIRSDGSLTKIEAPGAGATLTTLPWPSVNPAAPERMVRGSGRRASSVDYLVLNVFDNKPSWYLYLKSGAYYSGDAAGRHVRRIG